MDRVTTFDAEIAEIPGLFSAVFAVSALTVLFLRRLFRTP